jgi:hypothetical protein
MKPPLTEINKVLRDIEHADSANRHVARERIAAWRGKTQVRLTDAITNVHDDKGASVLVVDEVLARSQPDHLGKL